MPASPLLLVPYGPPALTALRTLVEQRQSTDPLAPVTVIVPSGYAGVALRRALRPQGLANVRFMVLPRLIEFLGSLQLTTQHKTPLTPFAELAVIRDLAPAYAVPPLGDIANHRNLHASLQRAFAEFRRLDSPALERIAAKDTLGAQLVSWFQATEQRLSSAYYSSRDTLQAAAKAVSSGAAVPVLRDLGPVLFYLPRTLSTEELALARLVAAHHSAAVLLGLTGEDEVDAPAHTLAAKLTPPYGRTPTTSPPARTPPARILSAPDAEEEVRWLLRELLARVAAGTPLHRIAVFYRQPEPYATLLATQLRFANLPAAGPDPGKLADTPGGRLLLGAVDALDKNLNRQVVLRWIAEAPVRSGAISGSDYVAVWDALSREAGIVAGRAEWRNRLTGLRSTLRAKITEMEASAEESAARIAALAYQEQAAATLATLIEDLCAEPVPKAGSPWRTFATWAVTLLTKFADNPDAWPIPYNGTFEKARSAVGELAALDAALPKGCTLHDFRFFLEQALSGPAGRSGVTGSGLFVAPLRVATGMDFDCIFVLGMAEGTFPPGTSDDPLLPDLERERLQLPGARAQRRLEERRAFLAALATAPVRTLSYARSDDSAHQRRWPSPWLLEQAALLQGSPIASDALDTLKTPWLTVLQSPEHAALTIAPPPAESHAFDVTSVALWWRAHGALTRHPLATPGTLLHRGQEQYRSRRIRRFTEWEGQLGALAQFSTRLSLPTKGALSPTRLERWATCPQRYFLGDVLGLAELESPEEALSISAADAGGLVHHVLERFYAELLPDKMPPPNHAWSADQTNRLLAIAAEEFHTAETRGLTGRPVLWSSRKRELTQDLLTFLEEDSRWRREGSLNPAAVEHRFGIQQPPVVMPLTQGGEVRFRGYIDRVDISADGSTAWVIDYKTGSTYPYKDVEKQPLRGGRHLQLPVYALAAKEAFPTVRDMRAGYWFISHKGNFDKKFVPLSSMEKQFKEVVNTISAGIARGLFPANPGGVSYGQFENCRFCDFNSLCPSNRDELYQRKHQDPLLKPYLALTPEDPL